MQTGLKILNPTLGESSEISFRSARRMVNRGKAKLVPGGVLLIANPANLYDCQPPAHPAHNAQYVRLPEPIENKHDAFPGRAVLPPSPEWLNSRLGMRRPISTHIGAKAITELRLR